MTIERTTPKRVATIATLRDGVMAGLLGGIVIAITHFIFDAFAASPLRTPAALYSHFFASSPETATAEPTLVAASLFTLIHFGLWMAMGLITSLLVAMSDAYPRMWYWAFGGIVVVFGSAMHIAAAFDIERLPGMHLWLGTMLGPAVMIAYLARRHPGVMKQLDRQAITPTEVRDIHAALAEERAINAYYRAFERKFGENPKIALAIGSSDHCVDVLLELCVHFDLESPEVSKIPLDTSISMSVEDARTAALAREHDIVRMYDRLLLAVEEHSVRDIFVKLRWLHEDEIRPCFVVAQPG